MERSAAGRRVAGNASDPITEHGDVRVGPIRAIPGLLAEHGIDPAPVLASVGVAADAFSDPENRLDFNALGSLLAEGVKLTRCPHFGLLVGARFTLDSLGMLGTLMRNSPTLRDALRLATAHIELQDRGAVALALHFNDSEAALGYSLFDGRTPAADQILDGSMAIHHRLLGALCGQAWKPTAVHLSHRRPKETGPLHAVLGPTLAFDTRISAVVFDARWLDHPIAGADPLTYRGILDAIALQESRDPAPFAHKVRRAIHAMMFDASASTENLANLFNLSERTLRRRLEAEGATVRGLVNEVRHELAVHLLRQTQLPVTEIAAVLDYSDATVFSRAFRKTARMSPSEWRARMAAPPAA